MVVEQTVDIPLNHRLYIDVPPEVPAGRVVLTFTPASIYNDMETSNKIWISNNKHMEELKNKLTILRGSIGKDAFGGMDGITYQRKVRDEWNG